MLVISPSLVIPYEEIEFVAIRAQGAGGQNVNKVSSAIHLRFPIQPSSLPESCKQKLLRLRDKRITKDGIIIIKAQCHRTQERNRMDALDRLSDLIRTAMVVKKERKPTKPSKAARTRRLENKNRRSLLKSLRGRVSE